MIFSLFFLIVMWLLVKWICLVLDSRRETVKMLRLKLVSYVAIVCLVLFGISWYTQILFKPIFCSGGPRAATVAAP